MSRAESHCVGGDAGVEGPSGGAGDETLSQEKGEAGDEDGLGRSLIVIMSYKEKTSSRYH